MTQRSVIFSHAWIDRSQQHRRISALLLYASQNLKCGAACGRNPQYRLSEPQRALGDRASLKRTQLPLSTSFDVDRHDLVLTRQFTAVVEPRRRVTRRQDGGIAKQTDVDMLAADMLDLQISRGYIGNELTPVVAFERIGEEEIISHHAVQGFSITSHHCFNP